MAHYFGKLEDTAAAEKLHPAFAAAFRFLRERNLAELPAGHYELDGAKLFVNLDELTLTPWNETNRFEAHRDYIDIQVPIAGPETIGIASTPEAQVAALAKAEKDCVLWEGKGEAKTLKPGEFAIFFPPDDAHAPGHTLESSARPQKKAIVKVLARQN